MISLCQKNYTVQLNSNCLEVSLPSLYFVLPDMKKVKTREKPSELQAET